MVSLQILRISSGSCWTGRHGSLVVPYFWAAIRPCVVRHECCYPPRITSRSVLAVSKFDQQPPRPVTETQVPFGLSLAIKIRHTLLLCGSLSFIVPEVN